MSTSWRIIEGDCREALATLPERSAHTCVTSPPYFGLRDYGHDGQIGLEPTPDEFVAALVDVFRGVRRVLRDDGTVWLNLGDSYAGVGAQTGGTNSKETGRRAERMFANSYRSVPDGVKAKDLLGIPWMVAFALRSDGWYLRSDVIWAKPNPMPESVTDRPTKAHEYVFLLSKGPRYFYDADAIREDDSGQDHARVVLDGQASLEPSNGLRGSHNGIRTTEGRNGAGRNKRSVWTVATQSYTGAHFATFPPKLIEPCILAGAPERACGECGAPWVRVMERDAADMAARYERGEPARHGLNGAAASAASNVGGYSGASRTLGFEPSCECPMDLYLNQGRYREPTAPGVVLDPFAGSGTTGMVALRHGRSFVGVELSPVYAAMARWRIRDDAPLLNSVAEAA